jgi:predicted lipoprotein with Yx(FWY)xxD motif
VKKRLLALAVVGVAALVAGIAFAFAATDNGGGSAQSGAATVRVKQIPGHGKVLVDAKGHALYRSDQERRGMVLCAGACLAFWQPLKVTGAPTRSSSTVGKLGIVKRPDGGRQVTDNGRLLYAFKLDKPGSVKGDGFKDAFGGQKFTWHVVRPVGASSSSGTTTTMPTPTYSYP